jgi:hypothetical protein
MTSRRQRRRLPAQLICGVLVLVLCVGASDQQARRGAKKNSVENKKPTLEEILGWLEDKVNAQTPAEHTTPPSDVVFIYTSEKSIASRDGCRVSVRYKVDQKTLQHDQGTSYHQDGQTLHKRDEIVVFDLAKLSPDTRIEKNELFKASGWQEQEGWQVIAIRDPSGKNDLKLNFSDNDLALRANKALDDAILLCGGKKTKELY